VKLPVPQQIMMDGRPVTPAMRTWMTTISQNSPVHVIDNVLDYGAIPDGATDNTSIFQRAIDTIDARGGGDLWVPAGRYYFTGVLTLPRHVSLLGLSCGPMGVYPTGIKDPSAHTFAPTMLVTNTGTPFLTSTGGRIADLVFYYPNQVDPDTSPPTSYAATIVCNPAKVYRCTFWNSYHAISISCGQSRVHDCFIGALYLGVYLDAAYDTCVLSNLHIWPYYDYTMDNALPAASPSSLGNWALANGVGIDARRVDSLIVSNTLIYQFHIGIQMSDSPAALTPDCGYGQLSNIDIDTCEYGIVCYSANNDARGWKFTNCTIGEGSATGQIGVYLAAGGSQAPQVQIVGGMIRGAFAGGDYTVSAGSLRFSDFQRITDLGVLTAPAVPATTVAATNTFPHKVRVHVSGGTVTVLTINATATGLTSPATVTLLPGETITLTYTVAPTWTWFTAG